MASNNYAESISDPVKANCSHGGTCGLGLDIQSTGIRSEFGSVFNFLRACVELAPIAGDRIVWLRD